jgi:hypothetical protein
MQHRFKKLVVNAAQLHGYLPEGLNDKKLVFNAPHGKMVVYKQLAPNAQVENREIFKIILSIQLAVLGVIRCTRL